MRLQYKILWFEDSESWFKTAKAFVQEFLDENGFDMVEERHRGNVENIVDLLNKNKYDLILMDFNLEGAKGDEIIRRIRNNDIYTDLLFYSQDGAKSLRNTIHEKGVDGIYCSSRDIQEFETKVIGIIRNTIRRIQDVNNMRGLVIAETIDLESRIENILKAYFKNSDEGPENHRKKEQFNKICNKKKVQLTQELQKIESIDSKTIEELIDEDILSTNNVFNALQSLVKAEIRDINNTLGNRKLETEEKLLLQNKKSELTKLKEEFKSFNEEIIKIRNTLAHVKEKIDNNGVSYLESINKRDGLTIVFDNNKYVAIRKDIRKHSSILSRIESHIFPNFVQNDEAAPTVEFN